MAEGKATVSVNGYHVPPSPMEAPPTNQGVEVYIPDRWTLDDPWGRGITSLSPRTIQLDIPTFSSLQTFRFHRLMHCTHQPAADSIQEEHKFTPVPYLATPGYTFEQRTQVIQGDTIEPLYPIRGEVLPGKYVWFSIDPDLSFEQKDTCKKLLTIPTDIKGIPRRDCMYRQIIKLADYIELHSRYGCCAFRIDLPTLLTNYRQSRTISDNDKPPDIYFKLGGTKRYKNTATYTVVVCAVDQVTRTDPLPNFPNLTRQELQAQQVFNPKGLLDEHGRVKCDSYGNIIHGTQPEYWPQGISAGQYNLTTDNWTYHHWDQLDFAFHFPSESEGGLLCGVLPQKVYHNYCVPLKRNKISECESLQSYIVEGVPPHIADRLQ